MAANLTLEMRPATFDAVLGLKNEIAFIKKTIAECAEKGIRPKPFLLKGLYGCGKTTLAYIIAKEVQGWEFTGQPQVREINAANIRGIGPMRELCETAGNYAMVGKYQVIILDEAHQLTKEAQEVLLKEFENKGTPTLWIICTTNPEKINSGVKDRCTEVQVVGMDEPTRAQLVGEAAEYSKYAGDFTSLLAELTKAKVQSPRKILKACEAFFNGLDAKTAVASTAFDTMPEYFEIAMGVVFGQWEKGFVLPWIQEKGKPKEFKGVGDQLKALDDLLKKKVKEATTETPADGEEPIEEADIEGRPEVARALRAITAASLKNQVYKGGAKAQKAADALFILSHCVSPNPFDTGLEFAATVGGLFRVWAKMQGK